VALRTLQKWHGAGNDFLVEVIEHGTAPWWTSERAQAVCARATGVGADGLLLATVGSEVAMVLYNADGSIAEMSGNGVRCLAAAVRRATHANWDSLVVHTGAGIRTVTLHMDGDAGCGSVAMGDVSFGSILEGTLGVAEWAGRVGGANVEFVTILDRGHVSIKVIERGVGWTLACGTGSVATAAICHRVGFTDAAVVVENPGGALKVELDGDQASLAGPVQFVANVEWLEA
jgi:diaminopimelate epimerase